jgi:hypothetical protein
MARIRGRAEKELPEAPPQYDSYTALLGVSLLATLTGLAFVALDYSDYSTKPPKVQTPASISTRTEQPGPATGEPPPTVPTKGATK